MVVEFITAFPSHSFIQIYEMPAQIFFTYYKKIPTSMAIKRVEYIEAQLLAEAKKWADKNNKHKVDREYNKLIKIAEGKYVSQ
jgi:predicted metal-dependent hydrolase